MIITTLFCHVRHCCYEDSICCFCGVHFVIFPLALLLLLHSFVRAQSIDYRHLQVLVMLRLMIAVVSLVRCLSFFVACHVSLLEFLGINYNIIYYNCIIIISII